MTGCTNRRAPAPALAPVPGSAPVLALALALAAALPGAAAAQQPPPSPHRHHPAASAATSPAAGPAGTPRVAADTVPADSIVAVVNGDAVTEQDVTDRARLFALSTGLSIDPGLLARLKPQITRQLIDEKLREQEFARRKIVVPPEDIQKSIQTIESRNGMRPHALEDKLAADGVSLQTLIDQIRTQIGWTHVLRQNLGEHARVTQSEIANRENALRLEAGQPEYDIAEIFIPIDDPSHAEEADHFAQAVIQQLRAGAPFGIVAAQFGQNQTALEGGDLGWVQADRIDPEVLAVAREMPIGAVSNPIRVAGGFDIVTLRGRRVVGTAMADVLDVREAFLPFRSTLDPQHPTADQIAVLGRARALVASNPSCAAIEAANTAAGNVHPSDPGPLVSSQLNPQMAAIVDPLKVGGISRPLVSPTGIAVIGLCGRQQKNLAQQSSEEIADQLLSERVELASRQENRDLHRRAVIDLRSAS